MSAPVALPIEKLAVGYLAGGQARRLGGIDKAFIQIGGRSIFERQQAVLSAIPTQLLNANGDASRFDETGLRVIQDTHHGYLGPLAGLLALMASLRAEHPQITHMISVATDAPFIPTDMVQRLLSGHQASGADIIMAASFGRHHPVFALWPVRLAEALEVALIEDGIRKIDHFTARYQVEIIDFTPVDREHADIPQFDPFMNINRPDDIEAAEALISEADLAE